MEALLLRHWVVRSARSSAVKTLAVEERVLGVAMEADGVVAVGEVMVFDMDSVLLLVV